MAYQIEAAVIEAVTEQRAYTVIFFEGNGSIVTRFDGRNGSYWITL